MPSTVLSVEELRFSYISNEGKFSVYLPALELQPGDFVGLVGSSGSGKSTLLDILGLVRKPEVCCRFEIAGVSEESVAVATLDVRSLWCSGDDAWLSRIRAHNLGYVLQNGGLIPFLSVGENIELPRRIAGLPVSRHKTVAAMEALGLEWGYSKPVADLSGGERQRVAILRAIAHRPGLILADEPTAAVDVRRAREVVSILGEMASSFGSAVLMVSHDRKLTSKIASRVLELQQQESAVAGDTLYMAAPAIHASTNGVE